MPFSFLYFYSIYIFLSLIAKAGFGADCVSGGLKLSDFVLQNLAVHIALAIRRIEEGFQIQHFEQKGLLLDKSDERRIATNILKRVSKATGITFPMEEIDYITLHLISKETSNLHRVSEDMQEQLRGELIDSMEAMHPAVKYDFQLVEDLLAHLSTMYIRLENGLMLRFAFRAVVEDGH